MTIAAARASVPWYADLTAKHWRVSGEAILAGSSTATKLCARCSVTDGVEIAANARAARHACFLRRNSHRITLLGWGLGGLIGGIAADYIGRKRMMMLSISAMRCSRA